MLCAVCVRACTICVFMDFVGLLAFVQHVTGMTTVRRNSITVDLDDSEAIVAHVCANSLVLPRGVFIDKGSYQ